MWTLLIGNRIYLFIFIWNYIVYGILDLLSSLPVKLVFPRMEKVVPRNYVVSHLIQQNLFYLCCNFLLLPHVSEINFEFWNVISLLENSARFTDIGFSQSLWQKHCVQSATSLRPQRFSTNDSLFFRFTFSTFPLLLTILSLLLSK